jgi:thymidylate synthase ThyX
MYEKRVEVQKLSEYTSVIEHIIVSFKVEGAPNSAEQERKRQNHSACAYRPVN